MDEIIWYGALVMRSLPKNEMYREKGGWELLKTPFLKSWPELHNVASLFLPGKSVNWFTSHLFGTCLCRCILRYLSLQELKILTFPVHWNFSDALSRKTKMFSTFWQLLEAMRRSSELYRYPLLIQILPFSWKHDFDAHEPWGNNWGTDNTRNNEMVQLDKSKHMVLWPTIFVEQCWTELIDSCQITTPEWKGQNFSVKHINAGRSKYAKWLHKMN